MTRAVSTVLDASLALLLVSAAAVALVAIPADRSGPPDPDATARAVLASTASATYTASGVQRTVDGRVGTLLGQAAVARARGTDPAFVWAVRTAAGDLLAVPDNSVTVVATAGGERVRAGPRPPPRASVAAVTHRVAVGNRTARVTVRTWSR